MPFYRSRKRGAPLKTDKHEITWSNLGSDFGTADVNVTLALGVASADKNINTECEVGSKVTKIYIEMNIAAETITNQKVLHWTVNMRPQAVTPPSPSLYYQTGRNNIIKRGMEMLPRDVATVYKRIIVVTVPKKSQRIGQGDAISITFRCSSTELINVCGFAIYKELY